MSHGKGGTSTGGDRVIATMCASHCGGACLLKVHVRDGVITRIESDDGEEPQLRGCLRGRAYRQRVYAPDRLLYPLKRAGPRGEGRFQRTSWDEALDTVAAELKRVRDAYGPPAIILAQMTGDVCSLNNFGALDRLLSMAGGYTSPWGVTSFQAGVYASMVTYGTWFASNTRDDLLNSRLIIMWGWDPASTITGPNTCWYLARAREAGTTIISVDPRHTDSAAAFADSWIPIRPGTDTAMLIAMAYVMVDEKLYDRDFIAAHTVGFDRFKDYVLGSEDGVAKTPQWAEGITGVAAGTIVELARQYATTRPAALMAGIAPGRTAYGEQFHRAAITLAAMTGNVGIHGGDAGARAWESVMGGFPYPVNSMTSAIDRAPNPVERAFPPDRKVPLFYRRPRVHFTRLADAILRGRAGGYFADYKALVVAQCNYLVQFPDSNKIARALNSLEFIVVEEQFMTPTAKFADIILPVATFMERNDVTPGVGSAYVGCVNKVIEPLGESRPPWRIAAELAERLGIKGYLDKTEEQILQERAMNNGVYDYRRFKKRGVYRLKTIEPYVAFRAQVKDPAANPFPTPSGKIEIYSRQWADLGIPGLPAVPKYIGSWEGRNDPLARKYPLQLITTHLKRRALSQFENIPWLRELQDHALLINSEDARARGINDGDMVRVFNDRGQILIKARVTERIMPGVVDVPHGAWYAPDPDRVDRGGCANVLTPDRHSPGGSFPYNTALVEVAKAS
ncbi:MAG: dimethyl sulfoxide reductase subunit A [Chloroflexi bacterium]|nr:dimethyl sulfoxide reductase subunit A [Chloroflexota bacterium]